MGDNYIAKILDEIQSRIGDFFGSFFAQWLPTWLVIEWTTGLIILFVVTLVIGFYLPFTWIRAGLGFILALGIAFYSGGMTMKKELKPPPKIKHK